MPRRDRIAAILAVVTILAALFAVGGAPRWAACLAIALAIATAIPYVTSSRIAQRPSPLLWLLGLAVAFTALQVLPLPGGLVELLSPEKHALVLDNAAALDAAAPTFIPLSYDPPATLVELAKLAGYLAFAYACLRIASFGRGRRLLLQAVALSGGVMAVTALFHTATGTTKLFGVYEPLVSHRYLAPLINPNHLAGYLAAAVPVCLGLAVERHGATRLGWFAVAALCGGTSLLAESRGAALALVLGLLFVTAMLAVQLRQGTREARERLPVSVLVPAGVVILCAIVLLTAFTAGGVVGQLADISTADELGNPASKAQTWQASTALVQTHPFTGVGRGAFEPAFTRHHATGTLTYSHVENEYLQALLDWGVVGAAALAVALAMALIAAGRRWRSGPLEAGALGAVAVLAVHNAVDFNLELPGVALAALAAFATLLPRKLRRRRDRVQRLRHRAARGVALSAAAIVLAAAASPIGRTARADASRLDEILSGQSSSNPDPIVLGKALMARHPADYMTAGLTAEAMFRAGDPRAVHVMNRALALNPRHSGLHHLAAQMLVRSQRPEQALVEYSLALANASNPKTVLQDLLAHFGDDEQVIRGLPRDPDRARVLATRLLELGRAGTALAYAKTILEDVPKHVPTLQLVSRLAAQNKLPDEALDAARIAHGQLPDSTNTVLLARALRAAHREDEACAVLEAGDARARDRGDTAGRKEILTLLATARLELGRAHSAREAAVTLVGLTAGDRKAQVAARRLLAKIDDRLGNSHQAEWERKQANELDHK